MITDEIIYQIGQHFPFAPTQEQQQAIATFAAFLTDRTPHTAMILRGSAGTGKTALAGAFVRTLQSLKQRVVLLAPTGRAAKVFSLNSGCPAYTIHRKIYREKAFVGVGGTFNLNVNLTRDTLYIIDEASMIGTSHFSEEGGSESFGSGDLLSDVISFVYSGENDRILFIGDGAQLPPIGEEASPALQEDVLSSYGLKVYGANLTEVLRQSSRSGILHHASMIRDMLANEEEATVPQIDFDHFTDIRNCPGAELIDTLSASYRDVGLDDTIVITRSNKRANIYNQGIRNQVLDREELLTPGDMVMVVKNNYHYQIVQEDADGKKNILSPFIANGDRARVLRVREETELYGFHFATVTLRFPDYDQTEVVATVLLNTLVSEAPSLSREQQEKLFKGVYDDYFDIPRKADRMKKVREDKYFNALQLKFAYAVTCHKAQGGQWSHVYVDQGYMTDEMVTPDYLHWLYTAFTRATEKLYLVNWMKETE